MADERLTLRQAAARLGVSESAVRKRAERGTLRSEKGSDGRRYVYLDAGADGGADASAAPERGAPVSEMLEGMREGVRYLREQLNQELERRSDEAERYQRIVAAFRAANDSLGERLRQLGPQQGTPTDTRETPADRRDRPRSVAQGPRQDASSPWWRFWR